MINVYFMLPKQWKGECVGGISLKEYHTGMKRDIWETYKVFPITEKTVLFHRKDNEFCTKNGTYEHEVGKIKVEIIHDEWLNVQVSEKALDER